MNLGLEKRRESMAKAAIKQPVDIRYFERNIFFTQKESIAIYKIPMKPYAYRSPEQKRQLLKMLEELLWVFRGKGQFLLLSRQLAKDELMGQLNDLQTENRFPELYQEWYEDVEQRFEERRPWTRELFVCLHLPKSKRTPTELDVSSTDDVKHLMKWFYRQSSETMWNLIKKNQDIELEEIEEAIQLERNTHNSLKNTIGLSKATPREMEWLCRRNFHRSIGEPQLYIQSRMPVTLIEKNGGTYFRPKKSSILSLFDDGIIQEKYMSLAVHHGEPKAKGEKNKTSYQSFLALTEIPEEITGVGNEWLYWLFAQDFPVDVSIRFQITDPQEEQRKLSRRRKELKGDLETKSEDQLEISDTELETMDAGRKLETKFSKGMPLVNFETVLAVSGASYREMEDRVKAIQSFYAPRFYRFSRIRSNLTKAFQVFIPGGGMNEYWKQPSDPGFLAVSGVHCNNAVGDPAGPLLGDTIQGFPVLYDLGRPMRKPLDRAGTIIILGTLGGGKSVTKKKLVAQCLLMGGRVFSVDPKGEDHCFEAFPEIKGRMKVLRFQAGETTQLPIFRLSNNFDRAWQIAKDFLIYLLNGTKSEERGNVIAVAVEKTMFSDKRTMLTFKDKMKEIMEEREAKEKDLSDEARRCLRLLDQYEKDPMAKVIFTDDGEDLALSDYPLVVASLKGLSLPKRVRQGKEGDGIKPENMTDSEKISVGIMYLVAALGREMLINKPAGELGMFSGDEVWMLTQIKQGAELIQDIVKLGRSMNIVPLLATQEASDVDSPEIRNNVGVVFAFRMNDEDEINGALSLLRISERGEEIYSRFRELESGECFFRDIEGRVNKIKVYVSDSWMKKAFGTSVEEPQVYQKGMKKHAAG
jgi:hypothetical protein